MPSCTVRRILPDSFKLQKEKRFSGLKIWQEAKANDSTLGKKNSNLLVHTGVRLYGALGISAYFSGVNDIIDNSLKDKKSGIKTHSIIFDHYYQYI